jgi:hypothetical protein
MMTLVRAAAQGGFRKAMPVSERIFYLICAALLLAGGVVFAWGGSLHPPTDARLGVVGSEEFFRNFVRHIVEHRHWELIHTGILAGPVCWALGAVGVGMTLRQSGEARYSTLGLIALAMGATAWAVAFVFDGFVALRYAQAISADPQVGVVALRTAFQANQVVVIHLGLVSWILIGWGMAALASSILVAKTPGGVFRLILGASGILLGAWPTLAWILGIFAPGPFTSRWWPASALLATAWFMAMGLLLLAHARSKAAS